MSETQNATLIITGDELLRGFVRDENTVFIANRLRKLGIKLKHVLIVGDVPKQLENALGQAHQNDSDLIITTGGLGPTHDDRTTQIIAKYYGRSLKINAEALELIEQQLTKAGRLKTREDEELFRSGNQKQATFPEGSTYYKPLGTAPAFSLTAKQQTKSSCSSAEHSARIVVLPGPPSELKYAWHQVEREIQHTVKQVASTAMHSRIIRVWGISESLMAQSLRECNHQDSELCAVTLCARNGELELELRGSDQVVVDALVNQLSKKHGQNIFALDDERSIAEIVGALLKKSKLTITTAESCTGGLLGARITDPSGASAWYNGSIVSYANAVKTSALNVGEGLLETVGAVSSEVAIEMAKGVRAALSSDIGVSTTGIAGPEGGSNEKPVGTVHIAVSSKNAILERKYIFNGDRESVRERTVTAALHLVREAFFSNIVTKP